MILLHDQTQKGGQFALLPEGQLLSAHQAYKRPVRCHHMALIKLGRFLGHCRQFGVQIPFLRLPVICQQIHGQVLVAAEVLHHVKGRAKALHLIEDRDAVPQDL